MPPAPSSHRAQPLQPTPQDQNQVHASQPHSRPPRSKGRNFTPDEECQLCRSVLHVSQDPRVGNGQKNATFWDRITTHFNNVAPSGKRPERSLESKWSAIKHDVSKFVGVHSQVEDLQRSGTSEADILVEALDLYKLKHPKGASFTYLHCWYLLRNMPRWAEGGINESRRSPSAPLSSRSRLEMSGGSEIDSDCASPQAQPLRSPVIPPTVARTRPQGSKAAKEDHRSMKTRDAAIRAQAAATKEMADATKRKADLLEDQNLIMLMTADEAGIINEDAREWMILRRRAELRKLRRKLAEDEEFEETRQEGRSGGHSTAGTTTLGPLQDDLDSPDNHGLDSLDNLEFPDNHRSTSTTSIGHQLDPQQQHQPTAFTQSGAEVAGLPRQQFRSTAEFPTYQWGGWGGLQLGSVANSHSSEHDIQNREQHWFRGQGTEYCSQRDEDTNDESQGELNLF